MGFSSISEYIGALNEEQRQHINNFIEYMNAEYPQLIPKISFPCPCGWWGKKCGMGMLRFLPRKTISPSIFPMRSF